MKNKIKVSIIDTINRLAEDNDKKKSINNEKEKSNNNFSLNNRGYSLFKNGLTSSKK